MRPGRMRLLVQRTRDRRKAVPVYVPFPKPTVQGEGKLAACDMVAAVHPSFSRNRGTSRDALPLVTLATAGACSNCPDPWPPEE
jgi:hypothetical protein